MQHNLRYVAITLIDAQASPTTSQVISSRKDIQDAIDWVAEWIHLHRASMLSHPIVAIYIFDTRNGKLASWSAEMFEAEHGRK